MSFDVLPAGNPAPDFSVATLGGATLSKEGLAGKVVLIDFWASWCLPCREAVPQLQALQQQLAGEPFVILGVSLDQDESAMRRFLADHGPTWPQHWDRGHQLVRRFQVKELPSYVVIGHDGRVTYSRKGYSATAGKILDHQVKTAVARVRQTQAAAAKP
jgi:thiol-disulfide isomerase/thioredoxin